MSTVTDLLPLLALRITAGPLELRGITDDDLVALCGLAQRQAVCALVFDHLEAEEVTSGAFLDNPASLAVSRKVGYRENGVKRLKRRDHELALNQSLVLRPEDLVLGEHELVVEGLPAFRRSIGLDPNDEGQTR